MAHQQAQQECAFSPLQSPVEVTGSVPIPSAVTHIHSSNPPHTSPLLCLPAELRNMIYSYAFDSATFSSYYIETCYNRPRSLQSLHLLEEGRGLRLTCYRIYQETTGYVGTYKHLIWSEYLDFSRILIVLGESEAANILSILVPGLWASIAFTRSKASFSTCAAVLEMFQSLEQLDYQGKTHADYVEIGFVRRKLEAHG
jgi:hypothetical protein